MKMRHGFTLIELLAVIGIMLVLMVAAFGVFNLFAKQTGPQAAVATVQAMLNAARDYAASNGVDAQVVFTADPARPLDGTTMRLEYKPIGGTAFVPVPARRPILLRDEVYVLIGLPDLSDIPVPAPAADPRNPTDTELGLWATYEKQLLYGKDLDGQGGVTGFAIGSDGKLKAEHREFYVVFDPAGYLKGDSNLVGMTVVQVSGNRVVQYVSYPLNANTGTRLVFE